jgi:hypothetical protein
MPVYARIEGLTTTAEALVTLDQLRNTEVNRPHRFAIKNVDGAITVYLGGSNVTNAGANGYELIAGASIAMDLYAGDELYAVAASGTPSIRILEIGNKA